MSAAFFDADKDKAMNDWLSQQSPDEYEKLRADPSLVETMVPEIIRWQTPSAHMARTALEDTEVGGSVIKAGDRVALWYISGNRDERIFTNSDVFDVTRDVGPSIAFGAGPHFCAGIDLAVFQQIQSDSEQGGAFALYEKIRLMQKSLSALEQCRLPVLAAIQGGAIGGAVDLVTACDLRYCTTDAFFSIEEINVGMTADVGTFPRILKLLPEAVVRELAYTGTRLGAERAERLGFVNAVLPDHDAVVAHTLDVAAEIARKAPLAIVGSKKAITWGRDHSTDDGLQQIALWNAGSLSWRDIQEAISARTEKRPAEFSDLPGKQNQLGRSPAL